MITVEKSGSSTVVTLLDKTAEVEDLEVSWDDKADKLFIRQQRGESSADVIVMSPHQADYLRRVLGVSLGDS